MATRECCAGVVQDHASGEAHLLHVKVNNTSFDNCGR